MHWFIDPIKNQFADFQGRTTRKEYWMFILVYVLIYIPLAIVTEMLNLQIIGFVFSLAVIVPSIAIAARRLHDIGKSGWWQLISLIPLVGTIILIVWLATKSEGDNTYGSSSVAQDGVPPVPKPETVVTNEDVPVSSDSEGGSSESQ